MVDGAIDDDRMQRPETAHLLRSIAEQLKIPLTVISRQAELGGMCEYDSNHTQIAGAEQFDSIRVQAQMALGLVDSYLLGLQLMDTQGRLELEPVSVSSLLVDIAHELQGLARHYEVQVEVAVAGRYAPVMAHPGGLRSALRSLGYALLGAQPTGGKRQLLLAVHRTPHGIAAGVYGQFEGLHADAWRRALALCGTVRQPFGVLSGDSGAGLFVAETIMQAMEARLRVGRYSKQAGLAVTLQPSKQLSFV